jgi:hypothetical protein
MCGVRISQIQSELTKEWARAAVCCHYFYFVYKKTKFDYHGRIPISYSFNIVPLLLSDDVKMIYSILFAI